MKVTCALGFLQDEEAAALGKSDLGKMLKKRTEDNKEKNEASIREQYCIRNCKMMKVI